MRAKEALHGTLVGGMPIRINNATRKTRENSLSHYGGGASDSRPAFAGKAPHVGHGGPGVSGGPRPGGFGSQVPSVPAAPGMPPAAPSMPPVIPGAPPAAPGMTASVPNPDTVRDDRGNPATKNLFVAGKRGFHALAYRSTCFPVLLILVVFFFIPGYGHGTTEQQLRELVGQYANVTGVVSKGAFSFVNTTDRNHAVLARQMLGGTVFNGGVLRINFAKETGRLGTSFDLTYNAESARSRSGPPPAAMNYYGRGGGGY